MRPPTSSSYWVIPGKFLAGGYPGAADSDAHRAKIQALLGAGVRTFVNLMEEDETNHSGQKFHPYLPVATQIEPTATMHRHPITDLSVPTPRTMHRILAQIQDLLLAEQSIYLHCWGGVGRTGTVVGCWLIGQGIVAPQDAIAYLSQLRKQDEERGCRPSPETSEQRTFVESWPL